MNKIKNYLLEREYLIIIFVITLFILLLPNFHKDLVIGDDYIYHLARIQTMSDSIKSGVFPIKINGTLANGFGYASSMFYPDLLLYIPSLLMVLFSISVITAYKIFIGLFLAFTFWIFYKSFFHMTKNRYAALFGTIFLMLSRVMYMSLYMRFALGEFLGFTFILPALVGIYDYLYNDFKSPQYLIIGFVGLLNCHLITGIIVLVFCIIIFLINIKISIQNPKRLLKLLESAILVLLVSSFFWIPMVEQLMTQKYKLSVPWTNIGDNDYTILDFLGNEKNSIGFSIVLSMPFVLYGLINKKFERHGKQYLLYFAIISSILVCPIIWKRFSNQLNIIQFRWRLLGIITTLYALSITCLFNNVIKDYSTDNVEKILLIISSVLIFLMMNNYYYKDSINNRVTRENIYSSIYTNIHSLGGGSEYLPVEITDVNDLYEMNTNIAYAGDKKIEGNKNPNSSFTFYKKDIEEENIIVPFTYYYGYVANIKTENGDIYPLEVLKDNNGLVKVKIPKEFEGEVRVWYNGTRIQKISFLISVTTIFLTMVILSLKKIKRENF